MTELRICRHNGLSSEQERALAKRLLKNALAERLPHRPVQFQLEYGKYGKPYLKDAALQVSVSYTYGICLIALSDGEIGADIERLRAAKPYAASRCFTDSENHYLHQDTELFDQRFYELWTQKEAYLKYTGEGFYHTPTSVDVLSPVICECLYTLTDGDFIISLCGRSVHPVSIDTVSLSEWNEPLNITSAFICRHERISCGLDIIGYQNCPAGAGSEETPPHIFAEYTDARIRLPDGKYRLS